ncbi:unnamed protein product [Camellia sinensis]
MVSARASTPPLDRQTQHPARASKLPLKRTTLQRRYWKMENYAQASKTPLERTDNNEGPARASKSPLEREGKNLGNYSWFLSPTNLFQTRPTQPKTRMQGVKDVNKIYTTTNSTEPKSGYNS